ncbi:GAF domain-containing protein [Ruegeria sp. R13_0]|uniref:GAF domain-containing protein n=1 Tax=Ruegeria sp. R13_0 TaxID=2821099 RepID=UPI001AD9652D|nr:GAF domain-containing protein [Ruegeria sp. R13_0]
MAESVAKKEDNISKPNDQAGQAMLEILQVISSSRDDERPVFDAILKHAQLLCSAPLAFLSVVNERRTEVTIPAQRGSKPEFAKILEDFKESIERNELVAVRPVTDPQVFRMDDISDDDLYRTRDPRRVQMVEVEGVRSILVVPLVKDGKGIGGIVLYRRKVRPFGDEDVMLAQNFAEHAVIAIENVRQYRAMQIRLDREAASRQILQAISQSRSNAQPVFEVILENAARLCSAPRALLLMRDEAEVHLRLEASNSAKSAFVESIRKSPHRLEDKNSIAVQAFREMRDIHVPDIQSDERMQAPSPQLKVASEVEGMRTVLVLPLIQNKEAVGVICLYKLEVAPFDDDEIELVRTFAAQAVIAIENAQQLNALEERTREVQALNTSLEQRVQDQVGEIERMGRLKRFLPAAVANTVVSRGSEKLLNSHRALLSVLFCDIRGFTAFCETAEPEETIEVLQTYHEEMGRLISDHGAGVDHRMGDGIMVLFNDPLPCDDPAGDAVKLAIAMRDHMAEICEKWKRFGHRLGFGVGISLGYATVGMVGYEGRYDYTASGTAVNLAARLCDKAKDGEILLSPRAYTAVEEDHTCELTGEVELKGIRAPVEVYRLVT